MSFSNLKLETYKDTTDALFEINRAFILIHDQPKTKDKEVDYQVALKILRAACVIIGDIGYGLVKKKK